jgi:hypothetical protein
LSPFSFEENISSFDTVENLASAGAVPVVVVFLASSANAGVARMASAAAVNTSFFMLFSSSAEVLIYNAGGKHRFRWNRHDAAR